MKESTKIVISMQENSYSIEKLMSKYQETDAEFRTSIRGFGGGDCNLVCIAVSALIANLPMFLFELFKYIRSTRKNPDKDDNTVNNEYNIFIGLERPGATSIPLTEITDFAQIDECDKLNQLVDEILSDIASLGVDDGIIN